LSCSDRDHAARASKKSTTGRATTGRGVLLLLFGATRRPKDAPRSGSFFTL